MKIKNLFAEALDAVSSQPINNDTTNGFKSPYTVSNQDALAKELSNIDKEMAGLSSKIIDTHKKNEFGLKIGMASEANFDKLSVLLQNTLSLNNIFTESPEIQKKLAELVSLAYYYAQRDPEKRFKVYSDKQVAEQVADSIFSNMVSTLKMTFLTYNSEFAALLKKAILAVIFYIKPKKA